MKKTIENDAKQAQNLKIRTFMKKRFFKIFEFFWMKKYRWFRIRDRILKVPRQIRVYSQNTFYKKSDFL